MLARHAARTKCVKSIKALSHELVDMRQRYRGCIAISASQRPERSCRRATMTRLRIASALTLAVLATTMWGQAANAQANPQDHEAHHPGGSAAQPAAPATPPTPPGMGQQQQGMMGGMNMMSMMSNMSEMMRMMGMMRGIGGASTIDRVEGRIAFLRAEIKITDAQASAWNAFADALRANAQKLATVRSTMMMPQPGATPPQSLADRLDAQERWLAARLEGTRAIK